MLIHTTKAASRLLTFPLLVGMTVVCLVGVARAFSSPGTPEGVNQRTCEFSLQLQTSVDIRKEYLSRVVELSGGPAVARNSVESMYGDIKPASYQANSSDDGEEGAPWDPAPKKGPRGGSIDQMSLGCLGCHDGVSAHMVGVEWRNDPYRSGGLVNSFGSDHPIGMDYNKYVNIRKGYKPVFAAGSKMLFVDGKVGCLTCHDPLNSEKGHLVMSDRHSALCTTCHSK